MSLPVVILGTGVEALAIALRLRREEPRVPLLLVDSATEPGGAIRTLRSEGFVCELGWQALDPASEDVACLVELLGMSGSVVRAKRALPRGLAEWACGLLAGEDPPITFRGGLEALVQAARVELGGVFALGRPVVEVSERRIVLGGEVRREILAERVIRTRDLEAARPGGVYLGFWETSTRSLEGEAGFVITPSEHPHLRGALFCSALWPGRALPGKSLVRCFSETGGEPEALAVDAERILRERMNIDGPLIFRRVHPELGRFASPP